MSEQPKLQADPIQAETPLPAPAALPSAAAEAAVASPQADNKHPGDDAPVIQLDAPKVEVDVPKVEGNVIALAAEPVKVVIEPPRIPMIKRRPAPVTSYPFTDDVDCRYLRRLPIPMREHPHIDWKTAFIGIYGVSPLTLLERETGAAILLRKNGSGYPINKPTNVANRSPLDLMKLRAGASPPVTPATPPKPPTPKAVVPDKADDKDGDIPAPVHTPEQPKKPEVELPPHSPSPGVSNVALPPSAPVSQLAVEVKPTGIVKGLLPLDEARKEEQPARLKVSEVEDNTPPIVRVPPAKPDNAATAVAAGPPVQNLLPSADVISPESRIADARVLSGDTPAEMIPAIPAPVAEGKVEVNEKQAAEKPTAVETGGPAIPALPLIEPPTVPFPLPSSGMVSPSPVADGLPESGTPDFIGPVKPLLLSDYPGFLLPVPPPAPLSRQEKIADAQRVLHELIVRHKEERLKLINEDLGSRMFDTNVQDDLEEELILMMERQQVERTKAKQAIDAIVDDGLHFLVLAEHEIDADACLDKLQWLINKIIDENEDGWVSDDDSDSEGERRHKDTVKVEIQSPGLKDLFKDVAGLPANAIDNVVQIDLKDEAQKKLAVVAVAGEPPLLKVKEVEMVEKAQDLKGIKDGKEGKTELHLNAGGVQLAI